MPPRSRPELPQALHLSRLAQGSPGQWVKLPGGDLRVVKLAGRLGGEAVTGWLICLTGEAVLDLPLGNFVRLRSGEGYRVSPGEAWTAFDTRPDTALLLALDR